MCGIAGYIGESKKPVLTYQLITKLFEKSESRGIDAAGYWGVNSGKDGGVLYHKEPGRSSHFVKQDVWKKVISQYNPNLLLVHARGASKGMGEPSVNHNNHPFTSLDKSVGLVHNGRVDDCEYNALKQKYGVLTQCDSEILLRIFEAAESWYSPKELEDSFADAENRHRLAGIRDIFSLINDGHMAVAIGERGTNGERYLWLFRNRHRPLWVVDMRESLGQIFFVSEPVIWEDAVAECSGVKGIARTQKLIELPTEEIWYFKITSEEVCPKGVQRFEVEKDPALTPWQYDGKRYNPVRRPTPFEVVTKLDERDHVIAKARRVEAQVVEYDGASEFPMADLEKKCDTLINVVNDIRQYVQQLVIEQSITKDEFAQLLADMDQQCADLEGLSAIISR